MQAHAIAIAREPKLAGGRRGKLWTSEVSAFHYPFASGDASMRLRGNALRSLYRGYPLLSGFLSEKGMRFYRLYYRVVAE